MPIGSAGRVATGTHWPAELGIQHLHRIRSICQPFSSHSRQLMTPNTWVLLGKGLGGNRQIIGLAEALGWPFEAKTLAYNPLNRCPNLFLGASIVSLDRQASSPLEPPWPDLVIAASRRSAPIARWIKKQA